LKRVLIPAALILTACTGGRYGAGDVPEACAGDTAVYTFRDTLRGVTPPLLVHSTLPRGMLGKVTVQAIVSPKGRIERGTVRTFGMGGVEGGWAAGDALFWSQFSPARRDGCAVRFLYRITYIAGLPQAVPDEPRDTITGR